jgi:hypothetical protein
MPAFHSEADVARQISYVRKVPILLQKAKIEPRQKSRERRFLSVSIAEGLFGIDTKVRGRFCVKRYGPSRRDAQHASAVLTISVDQSKNTFATKSATSGS